MLQDGMIYTKGTLAMIDNRDFLEKMVGLGWAAFIRGALFGVAICAIVWAQLH